MSIKYEYSSDKINSYIGQRISKKRKELGYTGSQLAKILDVSQQQVSRYERGKNKINLLNLFKIAVALKTPMHWFLEDIMYQLTNAIEDEKKEFCEYSHLLTQSHDAMLLTAETTLL